MSVVDESLRVNLYYCRLSQRDYFHLLSLTMFCQMEGGQPKIWRGGWQIQEFSNNVYRELRAFCKISLEKLLRIHNGIEGQGRLGLLMFAIFVSNELVTAIKRHKQIKPLNVTNAYQTNSELECQRRIHHCCMCF